MSFPLSTLFFSALGLLGVAVLLGFAGLQLQQPHRRFWGTAALGRAWLEIAIINLASASPVIAADVLILVGAPPDQGTLLSAWNAFSFLSTTVTTVLLPFWMAIRLIPTETTNPRRALTTSACTFIGFLLITLITFVFNYVLLLAPIGYVVDPSAGLVPRTELLPVTLSLTVAASFLLVLMRGALEIMRARPRRSTQPAIIPTVTRDTTRFYPCLGAAGMFTLALWLIGFVIYSDFHDAAYIPPLYAARSVAGLPFDLPTPLARSLPEALAVALPPLFMLALSLFIAIFVRPAEPAARLFALWCLLYGLGSLEIFPALGGAAVYAVSVVAKAFINPVQIQLALVLPRQTLTQGDSARGQRWLTLALYAPFALLAPIWLYFFLRADQLLGQMQEVAALMAAEAGAPDAALAWGIGAAVFWGLMAAVYLILTPLVWFISGVLLLRTWRSLARMRVTYASAPTRAIQQRELIRARNQLKWVGWGAAATAAGIGLWFLLLFPFIIPTLGGWGDVVVRTFLLFLPLATAFAILEYRLWDVDVIINRSLVYATLTALLAGLYAVVVGASSSLLGSISPVPALIAALAVAVAFNPFRERVQTTIDRLFYRSRLEFQRQLKELGQLLNTTIVLEDLSRLLTAVVPERLQLAEAWLVPPTAPDQQQTADELYRRGAALVVPLMVGGKTVGLYGLGPKRSGVPLNSEERDLMLALSYQAATALANARAYAALLEEHEQRERTIGEIHDTALGELTAAVLWLAKAEPWLARQPGEVQSWLAVVRDAVHASIKELRRAITVLEPESPGLSLTEALRHAVNRFARAGEFKASFTVQGTPRALAEPVEKALAHITREALNNVVKHGDAERVEVTLSYQVRGVGLSVADDGVGFSLDRDLRQPQTDAPGFGLRNMNQWAQRAGGSFHIQSAPGRGTQIEIWIPTGGGDDDDSRVAG